YKHSVPRFFVPEHGAMFNLALVRFPPTATNEIQYLTANGALTYTVIAGDPVRSDESRVGKGGGGRRAPDAGAVRVLRVDPRRDGAELRQRVGAQLQESALPDRIQVGEAIDLYASFYPRPADPRQLLEDLGLADKRKARFGKLSGGQKQRLSIALALIG